MVGKHKGKKSSGFFRVKTNENAPKNLFGREGKVSLVYKGRKNVNKVLVEFPIEDGILKIWLHWSQFEEIR